MSFCAASYCTYFPKASSASATSVGSPTAGELNCCRFAWQHSTPSQRPPNRKHPQPRLLHHSTTINIRGESYRLKDRRKAGLFPRADQDSGRAAPFLSPDSLQNGPRRPGSAAPRKTSAPLTAYSRSGNEILDIKRGGFGGPLARSVNIRAFHRSKHLVVLLFERASRCYEYLTATVDVFPESSEQRDAFGS